MRKYLLASLALVAMMFTSCKKESSYHTMSINYPLGMKYVYADQKLDSVLFNTTDNFQVSSNASWATINDKDAIGQIPNSYRFVWVVSVPIHFSENTGEGLRAAEISVRTFDNDEWDNTGRVNFTQFPWHDIYMPSPSYSYNNSVVTKAYFEAEDSATQEADTLKFYVYNKWTLTDGTFVHPEVTSGEAGDNVVTLHLDPNTTASKREDELRLQTAGGATSVIKFTQDEPKSDK